MTAPIRHSLRAAGTADGWPPHRAPHVGNVPHGSIAAVFPSAILRSMAPILCCLLLAGCGSGKGLARVKGRVTLNGESLEGAVVEFHAAGPGGSSAAGKTDAQGRYELMYTFDTRGAAPGEYTVTIRTAEICFDAQGNEYQSPERVPAKFNTRTELKRTVEPGRNTIDFDL
jgi:hypothetical protein